MNGSAATEKCAIFSGDSGRFSFVVNEVSVSTEGIDGTIGDLDITFVDVEAPTSSPSAADLIALLEELTAASF